MSIKGLTENRRLPRIGKLHLGIKAKKGEVEYPKAVDYFVLDSDHPNYDDFVSAFGANPKEIRIMFPVDDDEVVASQFYRCYSKTRGLICKGDGETAIRMVDTTTGAMADRDSKNVEMRGITCDGRKCPDYESKCRELMNLQFLIPEVPGLGIWQVDTSSINSIKNINGALTFIRGCYRRINFIPLTLAVVPMKVTPKDGKKKTVHILELRSDEKMLDVARVASMDTIKMLQAIGPGGLVLPTPDDQRPDLVTPEHEPDETGDPPMTAAECEEAAKRAWPGYDPKAPVIEVPPVDEDNPPKPTAEQQAAAEEAEAAAAAEKVVAANKEKPKSKKAPAKEPVPAPGAEPPADVAADSSMMVGDFAGLLMAVKAKGKTEGWLFKNIGRTIAEAKADPEGAWQEICQLMNW